MVLKNLRSLSKAVFRELKNTLCFLWLYFIIIIILFSVRPLEAYYRYYTTESFHCFKGLLELVFSFSWYFKVFLGILVVICIVINCLFFICREQILQMVEENPVIVVKGEPGCGKSTQVPQYIMEHWEASQRGAHCNIIITQPRRLSAISLAEWVAHERQERVSYIVMKCFVTV